MAATSFYDLKADDKNNNPVDFTDFKDKVVLVVNTASKCGFATQFKGFEQVHQKYKDQGLVVLGFPSNQFNQEPDTAEACAVNFGVTFPLMSKIEVNGDNSHEVYKYLKDKKSGIAGIKKIKWNFEKFLINKQGKVVSRYSSITKPEDLEKEIEKLLKE